MLRLGLLIVGGLLLLTAVVCATHPTGAALAFYLGFYGLVIVGGIVFERSRYRPHVRSSGPGWSSTGERFIDPTTGRLMEVRYNPNTGERDYVEAQGPRDGA